MGYIITGVAIYAVVAYLSWRDRKNFYQNLYAKAEKCRRGALFSSIVRQNDHADPRDLVSAYHSATSTNIDYKK